MRDISKGENVSLNRGMCAGNRISARGRREGDGKREVSWGGLGGETGLRRRGVGGQGLGELPALKMMVYTRSMVS
jgi:hypothetical protein